MQQIVNDLIQQGRALNEEKKFKRVLRLLASDVLYKYNNGELYYEAAVACENLIDESDIHMYDRARSYYDKAAYDKSCSNKALVGSGRVSLKSGDHRKALESLNKAIADDSNSSEYYYLRGAAYSVFSDQTQKAIDDLTISLQLKPQHAESYYLRGEVLASTEKYHEAIQDFSQAITLNPDHALAYFEKGNALFQLEKYDEALLDYEIAINMNPSNSDVWHNRACAWYKKGNNEKVIENLNQAIQIKPNSDFYYISRAIYWRENKGFDFAISDLLQVMLLKPESVSSWHDMAEIFKDQPQFHEHGGNYNFNIDVESDAGVHFTKGFVYYHLEDFNEAKIEFYKAIKSGLSGDLNNVAVQWETMAINKLLEYPNTNQGRNQHIREQAAAFLEKIRKDYSLRFKNATDRYVHSLTANKWDRIRDQPLETGIQGWLPAFMPRLTKWKNWLAHHYNNIYHFCVLTHDGEYFTPNKIGIPIKLELWKRINDGPDIIYSNFNGRVKKFEKVGIMLDEIIRQIRDGKMDDGLIFNADDKDK